SLRISPTFRHGKTELSILGITTTDNTAKNNIMTPRIETLHEKKLVGKRLTMSFANYKVGELWKSFMPKRKAITNNLSNDLLSCAVYKPNHFTNFNPANEFERWAAVEVADFNHVPDDLETFVLPG